MNAPTVTLDLALDIEAEECAAGIALDTSRGASLMYAHLTGADFYDPQLWRIIQVADTYALFTDRERGKRFDAIATRTGIRRMRLEELSERPRICIVDTQLHYPRRIRAAAAARRRLYRLAGDTAELSRRQPVATPAEPSPPPSCGVWRAAPHNHRARWDCGQPGCPDAGYRDPRWPDWHGPAEPELAP